MFPSRCDISPRERKTRRAGRDGRGGEFVFAAICTVWDGGRGRVAGENVLFVSREDLGEGIRKGLVIR